MSNKADDAIIVFAEEAVSAGYQVLSFDLPEHGDRRSENYACQILNCIHDFDSVMCYAKKLSDNISVFACSMGAYFSLSAYGNEPLKQVLFLSPVVNMERIINNMMAWFNISENRLKTEKVISTPVGQTFYWDDFCYAKEHPVAEWNKPTSILYGSEDNLCEYDIISGFSKSFGCDLRIMEHGEHYFHTEEQLKFFREWLKNVLLTGK
jgi:esterase/lipase